MMTVLRNIIICSAATLACASALAQSAPRSFKHELSQPDPSTRSRVAVNESPDIDHMLNRDRSETKIKGYRVRIFFDNSQTAREGANAVKRKFEQLFPDISVYLDFDVPYFKVTVGDCVTKDEAQMLLAKVSKEFASPYILHEEIPISNLIVKPAQEGIADNAETPQETAGI